MTSHNVSSGSILSITSHCLGGERAWDYLITTETSADLKSLKIPIDCRLRCDDPFTPMISSKSRIHGLPDSADLLMKSAAFKPPRQPLPRVLHRGGLTDSSLPGQARVMAAIAKKREFIVIFSILLFLVSGGGSGATLGPLVKKRKKNWHASSHD